MFFVILYLQFILGYSPVRTGLFFLMFSIPFVLVGAVSGKVDQLIGLRARSPPACSGWRWPSACSR
jgi:hypothetical protein